MLKSIVLLPNYSFCPISSTFLLSIPPLPHFPQLVTTLPLSPAHLHMLRSLLYQLCIPPALYNPWQKHPLLQQQNHNQTHTRAPKPSSSHTSTLTHPIPCISLPFQCHFYHLPKFLYLAKLSLPSPTPTVCSYDHQGVFYMICKQMVWHWTYEFVITNLLFQARDRNITST
jgi:hypothetical protein